MFCVDIHTVGIGFESRYQIAVTNGSITAIIAAIAVMNLIRQKLKENKWEIVYVSDNKTSFCHPEQEIITSFTVFDSVGVEIKYIE